ncbi:MAG: AAA family ATPase [Rhodothermales bacterium]
MKKAPLRPRSPYKGLMPYAEEDAPYFFGRETERDLIVSNLLSARLTLLYGPSGVGKSSVLYAGAARQLRELTRRNLEDFGAPEFVVVVFGSWNGDPEASLLAEVRAKVEEAIGESLPEPWEPGLVAALDLWTRHFGGELLLVLDQFEEYFLYHGHEEDGGAVAAALPRMLSYRGHGLADTEDAIPQPLRVNVMLSFREDALAQLDFFKGRIPNLFDNYLRLDYLTVDKARAAIVKPIEQYNELEAPPEPIRIEPGLVDAVLEEVLTGKVVLGEAGRGTLAGRSKSPAGGAKIETPFLQLVMTRLWEREMQLGSTVLRRSTLLKDLGGATAIIRSHLDHALDALSTQEKAVAARIFHYLVTPSGAKISHAPSDLAGYAGVPVGQVAHVLKKMNSGHERILRQVPAPDPTQEARYEIYHDKLAPAILSWRARYLRHRKARRNRFVAAVASLMLFGVLGYIAFSASMKATQAELVAVQAAVRADSVQTVTKDQLVLAQQSAATTDSPDGRYAVTVAADGGLRVLDLTASNVGAIPSVDDPVQGGQPPPVVLPTQPGERITATAFGPGGDVLATGNAMGGVRLWTFPDLDPLFALPGQGAAVTHIAFNRAGRLCAAAAADTTVRVWDVTPSGPVGGTRLTTRTRYDTPLIGIRFAEDGSGVVALGEGGRIARPCERRTQVVFVSSDRTIDEAETEASRARAAGFRTTIYDHPVSGLHTVAGPFCEAEAERALPTLRRLFVDAYVLSDVTAWCPETVQREGYLECQSKERSNRLLPNVLRQKKGR